MKFTELPGNDTFPLLSVGMKAGLCARPLFFVA